MVDSHTTAKSHLYVKLTGDTSRHHGSKAFAPAGAYDARMKLSLGGTLTDTQSAGLLINDNASADGNGVLLWLTITPASVNYTLRAYTYASSAPTQRGGAWTLGSNVVYLRHVRDGSNNCSFYFSMDGLAWQLISTVSFTFTPSLIGVKGGISNSSDVLEAFVDWLRTSV